MCIGVLPVCNNKGMYIGVISLSVSDKFFLFVHQQLCLMPYAWQDHNGGPELWMVNATLG